MSIIFLVITLLAAAAITASGKPAPQPHPARAIAKEFFGTAPSDIVQKQFERHFQIHLNWVDCRDNELCYQKWGKNCSKATN